MPRMSTEFLFVPLPGDWFLPIPLICLFDPRVLLAILLSIRLASPWASGESPSSPNSVTEPRSEVSLYPRLSDSFWRNRETFTHPKFIPPVLFLFLGPGRVFGEQFLGQLFRLSADFCAVRCPYLLFLLFNFPLIILNRLFFF